MLVTLIAACSTEPETTAVDVSPTATPTPEPTATPMKSEATAVNVSLPNDGDSRTVVALSDGGTGTIDNWEVTASFYETTGVYGYGKRYLEFGVHIEWIGESAPGDLMTENFLQGNMLFTSPSGETADVKLRRSDNLTRPGYDGWASNGYGALPDEAGTFFLTFAPHPSKHRLVWQVDLPHLDPDAFSSTPTPSAAPTETVVTPTETVVNGVGERLEVVHGENPYVFIPDTLDLELGKTYTLDFNVPTELHTFTLPELGIDIFVNAGEKVTEDITINQVGEFELICTPHLTLGMVGTVTVS